MEVLMLTVFLSLCLAAVFIVAFVRQASRREMRGWEQEALLPLRTDETSTTDREKTSPNLSYEFTC
jgi:hypothetical protein